MKRFSLLPLCCALVAGCSAPATQNSAAAPVASAPTTPTAETEATTAPATKTYRVSNLDQPVAQDPAEDAKIRAVLKKIALAPPPLDTKIPDKPRILMNTSRGPITLELDAKAAPLHVRSFLYLTGKKFYDGVKFHRYADLLGNGSGYIIQGGDPLTKTRRPKEMRALAGRDMKCRANTTTSNTAN